MIRRREWIFVVGGGLLAACAGPDEAPAPPRVPKVQPPDPKEQKVEAAAEVCVLTLTAEGQKIGRTYTRKTPAEAQAEALRAALPQGVAALRARVTADYAKDDVVVLRGWVLARTEARLLALGALQRGCVTV